MRRQRDIPADLWERLTNWGRWRWLDLMHARPDASCANPVYFLGSDSGDGYGSEDDVQRFLRALTPSEYQKLMAALDAAAAKPEGAPIDEADAERLHGHIVCLTQGHRSALSRRFVVRDVQVLDRDVQAAGRALLLRINPTHLHFCNIASLRLAAV